MTAPADPPAQISRVLKPDLCVIGAGSAGLSLAAAAAMFGVPVVLIEKGLMGGDCLNVGCVPSKALIAAGAAAHSVRRAGLFGIGAAEPTIVMSRVVEHVQNVIAAIAPNDSIARFGALGVTVLAGEARFESGRALVVGDTRVEARRFVVATGSRPAVPAIPGLADTPFLTNETIFAVTRKIEHLVVIGGGPVGVELAQAHRRLGARVTLCTAGPILGREEPELVTAVTDALRLEGVDVRDHVRITSVSGEDGRVVVTIAGGADAEAQHIRGSHLLVAAGREPVVESLDLAAAGVDYGPDGIVVDRSLRTRNRRVYAIGDCADPATAGPRLTHIANYHAGLVLRALLFRAPVRIAPANVPRVTYTAPELASVGLTEEQARAAHRDIRIYRWPFSEIDRAQAERDTAGHIKVVTTVRGRILGAHIVGAHAGDLITTWTLALARGLKLSDLAGIVVPYPTRSEISRRVAVSSLQRWTAHPLVRAVIGLLRRFG